MAIDYCALADVKARLPDLDASQDVVLGNGVAPAQAGGLISSAAAIIDMRTQRPDGFGQVGTHIAPVVRLFDSPTFDSPYGGRRLFLGDIVEVTQLRVKAATTSDWQTAALTDYVIRPTQETGLPGRYLDLVDIPSAVLGFGTGINTVEVTGVWGWPAVPAQIKEAAIELVIAMWRERGSSEVEPLGINKLGQPVMPRAIPPMVYDILKHYGRMVFA